MSYKFPLLSPEEVKAILQAWGFVYHRTAGSHERWVGKIDGLHRHVTVDTHYKQFSADRMKDMISQSGLSRKAFYAATKTTARKANIQFSKPKIAMAEVRAE